MPIRCSSAKTALKSRGAYGFESGQVLELHLELYGSPWHAADGEGGEGGEGGAGAGGGVGPEAFAQQM